MLFRCRLLFSYTVHGSFGGRWWGHREREACVRLNFFPAPLAPIAKIAAHDGMKLRLLRRRSLRLRETTFDVWAG